MVSRRTVLLYSPHFVAPEHRSGPTYRATPPLSHLALAGPLREAGYQVQIVDAKWDTDWRSLVRQNHDRLLCAGITSLTGPAVSDGLEFATFTKQLRPDLPLIGGAGTRALRPSKPWKTAGRYCRARDGRADLC